MIASTLVAATLAAAQPVTTPAPAPAPAMDHSKMDHGKAGAEAAKMDCCKDSCTCCAKMADNAKSDS